MAVATSPITRWLSRTRPTVFSAYAIVAAFSTYFCMYAFRKPFTAAAYEGEFEVPLLGALDWKIILVVSQILGYTLSKFLGIKVVSEMSPARRGLAIVVLIAIAEGSLLLFAVTPAPWSAIWLFTNGIPLGMIWGMVFGFLEGRRTTEALGAGLSASYIVASGAVKTVGAWVLGWGVSEELMPAVVGLIFFPFLLLFVFLLTRLPPPTAEDEAQRVRREPMNRAERHRFLRAFWPGLVALTALYVVLTAYRTIRDDFAADIWRELGFGKTPEIMTWSELPVAFGVLVGLGALMRIRDNRKALLVVHGLMVLASALVGLATLAFEAGLISPEVWMITIGLGLYLAYVPFGSMLFDRLIAAVGWVATAGFMIYVTDAFGYVGSVSFTLYRSLGAGDQTWLEFFIGMSYATSILCAGSFLLAGLYFARRTRPTPAPSVVPNPR